MTSSTAPIENVQPVGGQPPEGGQPTEPKSPPAYADPKRAAVEQKYQELYGAPAPEPEAAPAAEPTPEPVAAEPAAPQKTVEDVLREALAPMAEQFATLKQEIAALKQPVVTTTATATDKTLVEYLQAGDVDGFEKALQGRIARAISGQVTAESTDQAVERVRAEQDVKSYLEKVEAENQDLVPMKDWVIAEAQRRLEAVVQSGQAKTIPQFVAAYKQAVNDSVVNVRKAYQQIRGAGKSEALTVKKTVVSSTPLPSNQVVDHEPKEPQPTEPNVDPGDYIARRQAASATGRGLLPK